VHSYRVTALQQVDENDVGILDQDVTEQVTLMNCLPIGHNSHRGIVIGQPFHEQLVYDTAYARVAIGE
jgi:LPXTG-site transpeptidase (sortase) family protein